MSGLLEPADESRSLDLVARIQDGDEAAWNELFLHYHDPLLLAVRLRLGTGLRRWLESADVFQSVALEAFQALPSFEYRGQGSLEAFLKRVVLNKIRDRADHFAARKREGGELFAPQDLEALVGTGQGPVYHDGERYERLERGLRALPDEFREVLVLRKLEGLSSQETAARLQKSDDAVRKLTSRALARLSQLLR